VAGAATEAHKDRSLSQTGQAASPGVAGSPLQQGGGTTLPGKAKAAIFVRLGGCPSHMDTFDLKPDAPETHRGEFKPIATNADGVQICEHLPLLAKCADKFAILRGVSHTLAAHELGSLYMGTGNRPIASLSFPAFGAVVSKELGSEKELPGFVAVPSQGNNPTGYLGVEYGPFDTGATPVPGKALEVRGLALRGVTLTDVDRRQNMVQKYDTAFGAFAKQDKILSGMDEFGQKAYQMMRSTKAREAFDLSREPESISGLFGDTLLPELPAGHAPRGKRRALRHRAARRMGHPCRQLCRPQKKEPPRSRPRSLRPLLGPRRQGSA